MNLKNKGRSLVAVFIILAVYNVITFAFPFNRNEMFWIGYGFSMVAIFLTAGVGFYSLGREGLKSKFYGWPLLSLVWSYLFLQLIVGLLEMVLSFIPFPIGIVINVILLGACLIGLIATDVGKEEIERIDKKIEKKVFFIKSLQADVEGMAAKSGDEATKKLLKDLAEAIRYSDPMSIPQLVSIESKIEERVASLANTVNASDSAIIKSVCDEVQQLIAERNSKCIILK